MSTQAATLEVRRVNGKAGIVDITGEITAASEEALMEAYEQASADNALAIILNFGELEYMNSGGIGLLVTLLVRTNRMKQRLGAFGLTEHYRRIFGLTRLDEAIAIYDDETTALAAAGGS